MKIPPLEPRTPLERDQFEAGKRRALHRKEARRKQQQRQHNIMDSDISIVSDHQIEAAAEGLLREAGTLKTMPSLANPQSILTEQTKLQNCELAQPQTANLANQIFGGFLMRRAFDLAYATAYVFSGYRPRFLEVDRVDFTTPVNIGDLINFSAQVIYAHAPQDDDDGNNDSRGADDAFDNRRGGQNNSVPPVMSVEVSAWIVEPEQKLAKLSDSFIFTFSVATGTKIRKVLPSNMEEARKMAIQMSKHKTAWF